MSSPVKIPFDTIITIDRSSSIAVYLQIAQQIINAIQRGYLLVGSKLPGSRSLSIILGVHRQTIVSTYNELELQGWIETRPNKGTYIIHQSINKFEKRTYKKLVSLAKYPEKTGYSFSRSNLLDDPFEKISTEYSFNDGLPDYRLVSFPELSSLYSSSLKRKINKNILTKKNHYNSDYYQEQLSNYLNLSRGLHVSPKNILVTRSTSMSIYLLTQLLIKPKDVVIIGKFSMFSSNMIFQQAEANLMTVSVDENGIVVEEIKTILQITKVRCIYITPHHHYPTTVSLSAKRRVELLSLAEEHGIIIIEDDYDFDFQYESASLMPLASGDVNGMVIYVGTFGKSLIPGFNTGFVTAPSNLIQELQKYQRLIDSDKDVLLEQVLGEMIEEGNIHRHNKKSMQIYKNRRDHLCNLIDQHFKDLITYQKPKGGLALWTEWHMPINLLKLSKECLKYNLHIPTNILYQNKDISAMRIGFGHMTESEMDTCMNIIKERIESM